MDVFCFSLILLSPTMVCKIVATLPKIAFLLKKHDLIEIIINNIDSDLPLTMSMVLLNGLDVISKCRQH